MLLVWKSGFLPPKLYTRSSGASICLLSSPTAAVAVAAAAHRARHLSTSTDVPFVASLEAGSRAWQLRRMAPDQSEHTGGSIEKDFVSNADGSVLHDHKGVSRAPPSKVAHIIFALVIFHHSHPHCVCGMVPLLPFAESRHSREISIHETTAF